MTKIALVANTAWNIYNFRMGLIRFLRSKGYEVIYIAPYDEAVEKIGDEVPYFPITNLERKGYNPVSDLSLTRELFRIFKSEGVHIALSYTIKPNVYSCIAGYLAKIHTIPNITGLGFVFLKNSMANKVARRMFRFSLGMATHIVFQNKSDKKFLEENGICDPRKTLLINGSGINTELYRSGPVPQNKVPFVFLFVGRLLYDKGVREFAGAAEKLAQQFPGTVFYMLGAVDEGNRSAVSHAQLEEWLQANPALKHLGNQDDVRPYIEQCDAVVLPSYREGIPRVLLEAMAMQRPFVTVRTPGCEDVTEEGVNGLLAEPASTDSLYEQMKKMRSMSPEQRNAMGEQGRRIVLEKYDEKIIVEEYLKLILPLSQ